MTLFSTITSFINERLIDSDRYLAPEKTLGTGVTLYETRLFNSFVQTVIEGSAIPAPFQTATGRSRYKNLLNAIADASGNEQACVFYGCDPDNAMSVLSWVRPCVYDTASHWLSTFETSPADEGGNSWLGIADATTTWTLLHELEPSECFKITLYGPQEFRTKVTNSLGISTGPDINAG